MPSRPGSNKATESGGGVCRDGLAGCTWLSLHAYICGRNQAPRCLMECGLWVLAVRLLVARIGQVGGGMESVWICSTNKSLYGVWLTGGDGWVFGEHAPPILEEQTLSDNSQMLHNSFNVNRVWFPETREDGLNQRAEEAKAGDMEIIFHVFLDTISLCQHPLLRCHQLPWEGCLNTAVPSYPKKTELPWNGQV